MDSRLIHPYFPRASAYNPEWIIANGFGSHPLWTTEWLTQALPLNAGDRVLDLGCGKGTSSIFLAREFGVQVWATDLWTPATELLARVRDAGVADRVYPIHADARSLPFAGAFFDAIVSIDSFYYFGTDALYMNYLTHFVKPGGLIGVCGAGLTRQLDPPIPEHLRAWWTADLWSLQTADWLRRHWERSGVVDVERADTMPDGWKLWLAWHKTAHPQNQLEIEAIEADEGRFLGYVRGVARRRPDAKFEEYCWPDPLRSMPISYTMHTLLRTAND